MPPYSGTIALVVGLVVIVLQAFGIVVAPNDADTLKSALGGLAAAIPIVIGIWRLLHTKGVADTLSAQVTATGKAPVAGPDKGTVPTESDVLNAQQIVRKATAP